MHLVLLRSGFDLHFEEKERILTTNLQAQCKALARGRQDHSGEQSEARGLTDFPLHRGRSKVQLHFGTLFLSDRAPDMVAENEMLQQ